MSLLKIDANSIPDRINSLFEMTGGGFILLNVLRVMRDKQVHGVSLIAVTFFAIWGLWNLFYYRQLNQKWSWYGCSFAALANITWLILLIYWKRYGA